MVKRRSLDDALTPEEESFLQNGKQPKPTAKPKAKSKATTKAIPKKEEPTMAKAALKDDFASRTSNALPSMAPEQPFTMAGAVSLNVRIEPEISIALLRASMDRKIRRVDPFTQRDIVAEALAAWLKMNGYLQ